MLMKWVGTHETMILIMLLDLMIYEACIMVLGLSIPLRLYRLAIIFRAWEGMKGRGSSHLQDCFALPLRAEWRGPDECELRG